MKTFDELYREAFEDFLNDGYFEDEADQLTTEYAGKACGYGPPDLFW